MSCSALPSLGSRPSCAALLACGALFACTEQRSYDGPLTLSRHIPTTSEPSALAFDGLDDYATTGTAKFPSGQKNQTASAWFQLDSLSGKQALITLRKDEDSGVELGLKEGRAGAWRVSNNSTLVSATTPVTVGTWHHFAYTFDTSSIALYVDGTLVASATTAPDERTPTTCWLGTLDGARDLFQGQIDHFRISASALSATQIAAEAAGNYSNSDAGLVLDLPCDEASGDLIFDHSSLANDGLLGDGIEQSMPHRVHPGMPANAN